MKLIIPASILALGALVVILHTIALTHAYYFLFSWYDIMMHFLGGLLASLFGYYVLTILSGGKLPRENRYWLLADVILFVLIVGLFWETFELMFELTLSNKSLYVKDTILDFIMNTTGAVVGFFYFIRVIKKDNV